MRSWFILVVLSAIWAGGDMLYKAATNAAGEISTESFLELFYRGALDMLALNLTTESKFLILFGTAMTVALAANILFSIPLSRLPVSIAKPALNSLTIAFIAVFSVIIFNEPMTGRKITGLVLVTGGVWLLST